MNGDSYPQEAKATFAKRRVFLVIMLNCLIILPHFAKIRSETTMIQRMPKLRTWRAIAGPSWERKRHHDNPRCIISNHDAAWSHIMQHGWLTTTELVFGKILDQQSRDCHILRLRNPLIENGWDRHYSGWTIWKSRGLWFDIIRGGQVSACSMMELSFRSPQS